MSTAPETPIETLPSPASNPSGGLRRRDLLAGAIGAVAGLSGGMAAGSALAKKPRRWAGDMVLPPSAKVSYAQLADDLVVATLLERMSIQLSTYLDIGAFDPIVDSNTYLFYLAGARGVLVEPNQAITPRLKSVRPNDTILVAGIGIDDATEADFYMLKDPALNTFDKDQADRMVHEGITTLERVVKAPLLNINRVIAEHFAGKSPDFISIDIEGLDYAVLKTLDFSKYRPKVICAETLIAYTNKHNPDTTKLLIENGYEVRGLTFANTVFLDKKLIKG